MKKSAKKWFSILLAMILMLSFATAAMAGGEEETPLVEAVPISAPAPDSAAGPAVMINGELLEFPDAQPEYSYDRTMIPVRALMEELDAEVDYLDGTVIIKMGGYTISLVIGEEEVTVTDAEGKASTVKMDCASYIKDDRTYVPLRFVSEAAGYDIFWDALWKTAIVIDKDAVVAELDKKFAKLDALMAFETETITGNQEVGVDMNMSITAEGETIEMEANAIGISGANAVDVSMTMDMTLPDSLKEDSKEVQVLLDALKEKGVEYIMNMETGIYYIKFPSEMISMLESSLSGDVWMKVDMNVMLESILGMSLEDLTADVESISSYGEALYDTFMMIQGDSIYAYEMLMESAEQMASILDNVTVTDDSFALVLDLDDINALESGVPFDAFELNISGTADGAGKGKIAVKAEGVNIDITFDVDAIGNGTITFSIEVDELMSISMDMKMTAVKTDKEPRMAPPTGAAIIDVFDMIEMPPMPMLPAA